MNKVRGLSLTKYLTKIITKNVSTAFLDPKLRRWKVGTSKDVDF